jgi:hypothetical protein
VTPFARFLAILIGAAGMIVAMAALVREAVLAAEPTLKWRAAPWWADLTARPSWALTVAAVGTGLVAIFLIVLAVRQLRAGRARRQVLEFGGQEGQARLDVHALERALTRSAQAGLEGTRAGGVTLSRDAVGWWARLEAAVPARDLAGLQARAAVRLGADLERLGGMDLSGVDVVVTGFTSAPAKAARAEKKKTWE